MPSLSANELIGDSFALLNVFLPGESVPANDAQFARRQLNDLLSEWRQRRLMIPLAARELFDLDDTTGGPYDPYTIGPGGDFDTDPRPPNQNSILMANLVLTSPGPPNEVRVPLGIFTTTAYFANQIPGMTNNQPTGLFYNPTYADDLGAVFLWPVPNTDENDLELLLLKPLALFDDLSTVYDLPDGAPKALKYALADLLQTPYGRTMSPAAQRIAVSSVATYKRSNVQMVDLLSDAAWCIGRARPYNLQTDAGG